MGRTFKIFFVVLLLGIFLGVVIGPQAQTFFWSAVLDYHPNPETKTRAALHLKDNLQEAELALMKRVGSTDRTVRDLAAGQLASAQLLPLQLLPLLRSANAPESETSALQNGLNYFRKHEQIFKALKTQLQQIKNPAIKQKLDEVMLDFAAADAKIKQIDETLRSISRTTGELRKPFPSQAKPPGAPQIRKNSGHP
jgi:hypothetical protein